MRKIFVLIFLLLAPSLVFGAGFAKQSLFLSKASVTEGETVLIHAVVSNDATGKFSGELVFKDSLKTTASGGAPPEAVVGSVAVALAAGEATTKSISWKPLAGTHTVTAQLQGGDGAIETQSATFTISPKPVPAAVSTGSPKATSQAAAPVQSSAQIQQTIASYSPAVASGAAPVFTIIDSARRFASDKIDTGINWSKSKIATPNPGSVLGVQTGAPVAIAATAALYILTILQWLIGNAGIFYPILAIAFLYFLWRLGRRMRRPY